MKNKRLKAAILVLWSVFLFAATFVLHTRHNGFPYFYHPDEPGKVEQVMEGKWNFHHPMLLLTTSKLALDASGAPRTEQRVVEIGRNVSAGFTAAAVVALSLLAWQWRRWYGAVAAAAVLALHHQLYELAHYMKEDSALLFGMAATVLAAAYYMRHPSRVRAALLGAACALAISGKYLGVMSLAIAVPVLLHETVFYVDRATGRRDFRAHAGAFALMLLGVFALVNLPLFTQIATFRESFSREVDFVVHGQKGMTRSVPHSQYWSVFLDNTTPAIWLFLLIFLIARWHDRRAVTMPEWIVIAFPFAYALALSFSPKSNDRYFLPATAMFTLLAVLGIEDAAHMLAGKLRRRYVWIGGTALLVIFQVTGWSGSRPGLWRYDEAFQRDDLQEMIAWINAELPRDAVIAKDNRVGLPDPARKKHAARMGVIPQKVMAKRYAADVMIEPLEKRGIKPEGTLDELRSIGVTHVIASESDYGKFFLQSLRPQKDEEESFTRRKAFYEALFREGELLKEWERGTVIYLHPGLRVYRIQW